MMFPPLYFKSKYGGEVIESGIFFIGSLKLCYYEVVKTTILSNFKSSPIKGYWYVLHITVAFITM